MNTTTSAVAASTASESAVITIEMGEEILAHIYQEKSDLVSVDFTDYEYESVDVFEDLVLPAIVKAGFFPIYAYRESWSEMGNEYSEKGCSFTCEIQQVKRIIHERNLKKRPNDPTLFATFPHKGETCFKSTRGEFLPVKETGIADYQNFSECLIPLDKVIKETISQGTPIVGDKIVIHPGLKLKTAHTHAVYDGGEIHDETLPSGSVFLSKRLQGCLAYASEWWII